MKLTERIQALVQLGNHLSGEDEYLQAVMKRTEFNNAWFTMENQERALNTLTDQMLAKEKLQEWIARYEIPEHTPPKTVGLVLAGNIPLVGFHDVLCVFVAGHRAQIKLSEKDKYLLPYLFKVLERIDPRTADYFSIVERLEEFDAVIATGSDNTARYFKAYFGKYPHIIRRNRNGIAVLTGEEDREELEALGRDIFQYFGLGCRNVSKVYVPRDYDFEPLLEALHSYREIVQHNKYKNNFDYNFAVRVLNKDTYKNNGCLILSEQSSLQSRIGELHYEYYNDLEAMDRIVKARAGEIQCVVAKEEILSTQTFRFGQAQEPALWDYADGVDTLAFLLDL